MYVYVYVYAEKSSVVIATEMDMKRESAITRLTQLS